MLGLTRQEEQASLFLIAIALIGLLVNFSLKLHAGIRQAVRLDAQAGKLDINQVKLEELLSTRLVSQKLAQRIIAYRQTHGPFTELEELKEVKGIGEHRYEKLKEWFYAR